MENSILSVFWGNCCYIVVSAPALPERHRDGVRSVQRTAAGQHRRLLNHRLSRKYKKHFARLDAKKYNFYQNLGRKVFNSVSMISPSTK